ncbi:MAG: ABC transporter ATP-binding protein [Bacteriovoracaceae bacterium]|nr:ABC transporter ATP-binding protein [Bacteriovoracaceae bacterium]
MNNDVIIRFTDVHKKYKSEGIDFKALDGVSLEIHKGEFLGISGKSGSGKTTLLNVAGLIDRPTRGELIIKDHKISSLDDDSLSEIRAKEIGFIFQTFNLLPMLSALENVEYPLMLMGLDAIERRKMAEEALRKVGLDLVKNHKPSQMSGGQRQRVAIARAIVKNPSIILADEPTANLDSKTSQEVFDLLVQLQRELHITVLLCSHDNDIISQTKRVIKIADGKIIEEKRL